MESLLESVKEVAQNKINFAYLDPEMVLLTSDRKYKVGLVGMLFEDKITMQSDFDIDDESEPNVEDMLEGMHRAIDQYQKPDQ